jgi:hypothetical protein
VEESLSLQSAFFVHTLSDWWTQRAVFVKGELHESFVRSFPSSQSESSQQAGFLHAWLSMYSHRLQESLVQAWFWHASSAAQDASWQQAYATQDFACGSKWVQFAQEGASTQVCLSESRYSHEWQMGSLHTLYAQICMPTQPASRQQDNAVSPSSTFPLPQVEPSWHALRNIAKDTNRTTRIGDCFMVITHILISAI